MNLTFRKILIIIILIILIAAILWLWYFWASVKEFIAPPKSSDFSPLVANQQTLVNLKQTKLRVLTQIRNFKQYGEWPLLAVPLSEKRGNPFAVKK